MSPKYSGILYALENFRPRLSVRLPTFWDDYRRFNHRLVDFFYVETGVAHVREVRGIAHNHFRVLVYD